MDFGINNELLKKNRFGESFVGSIEMCFIFSDSWNTLKKVFMT